MPVFGSLPVVPVVFASLDLCGCVGWSGFRSGDRDKVIYRACYYYSILPVGLYLHCSVGASSRSDSLVRCQDLGIGFVNIPGSLGSRNLTCRSVIGFTGMTTLCL